VQPRAGDHAHPLLLLHILGFGPSVLRELSRAPVEAEVEALTVFIPDRMTDTF